MNLNIYLKEGIIYIPTVAKTEAGFYLDIDPIAVVSIKDVSGLIVAIESKIEAGNPRIRTPSREQLSMPAVLKHTKFATWRAFEREMKNWGVQAEGGAWMLTPYRSRADGRGFEEDVERAVRLGDALPVAEAARRIASAIANDVTEVDHEQ